MFFDRMDGADIGMIERRSGTRLALGTLPACGIPCEFFRQELQAHATSELNVFCLVNDAHAAAAENVKHPVMRDALADQISTYRLQGSGRSLRLLPLHCSFPAIAAPR